MKKYLFAAISFFYWSKLNATQNNYKMYKKLMNSKLSKLTIWPRPVQISAHRSTYQNDFGWNEALCDFYAWSMT